MQLLKRIGATSFAKVGVTGGLVRAVGIAIKQSRRIATVAMCLAVKVVIVRFLL